MRCIKKDSDQLRTRYNCLRVIYRRIFCTLSPTQQCLPFIFRHPRERIYLLRTWIDSPPIWGRRDPGGPHDGPMNFAISAVKSHYTKVQYDSSVYFIYYMCMAPYRMINHVQHPFGSNQRCLTTRSIHIIILTSKSMEKLNQHIHIIV